jgi:signal peptidase I
MAAAVVAFLLFALSLVSAWQQILLVFFALIPLAAGIGILRRRVWSAYGFALFQLAQIAALPLIVWRGGSLPFAQLIVVGIFYLVLGLLFFGAGRSLAATGTRRGSALPWIVVSCLFTLPLLFVHAFVVPTGAMEDTLLIGDRILVRVFPSVHPAHGDIVVFRYPMDRSQIFIKRVIGMPGDRVRIASRKVYRNGSALNEPYAVYKFNNVNPYRDNLPGHSSKPAFGADERTTLAAEDMLRNHVSNGEVVVPPGKYFVLGDNRDNSLDSRYWGFLNASDLIGEPILIYDSEVEESQGPPGAKPATRHLRRWNRLFKLL